MILSHILFAPSAGVGGANAIPIIQAGRTDKHDYRESLLWRSCRKNNRQPKIITIEELAGCRAEQLTTQLCQFSKVQPIPVYFYQDLNPITETNRCCVASTLTGCVGKYIKYMRNIDIDNPYWKDLQKDESPSCWPSMRQAFYEKSSVNQIKWQDHYEWGMG